MPTWETEMLRRSARHWYRRVELSSSSLSLSFKGAAIQWVNPERSKLVWDSACYQVPDTANWFVRPMQEDSAFVRMRTLDIDTHVTGVSAVRSGPNTIAVHVHREQQKGYDTEFYRRIEELGSELVWEYCPVNNDRRIHAFAVRYVQDLMENRSVAVILSDQDNVVREKTVLGPYVPQAKREFYSHHCLHDINRSRTTHLCVADPQPNDDRLWISARCESIQARQPMPENPVAWWDPKPPTTPKPEPCWGHLSLARVTVESYHDFQTCEINRNGHLQCIGLLFRKVDGSRHVFGQWRDDKAQSERHMIPSDMVFCNSSSGIDRFVNVQRQAIDGRSCIPIRGELEWFYSAKTSRVRRTETLLI
ncbi:hypothetical protein Tdes44962_MAKER03033 [Teratosphaeria destructans]|uniref:Uncharacterized protein n=1 Tax=Teratosphaeria destructans TaxID=418781 RepID=A0A9W7SRF3_9PEZI|nr:hypothetical protein Tdes44962_MAKER03033 [Teratosphaeria destructans]